MNRYSQLVIVLVILCNVCGQRDWCAHYKSSAGGGWRHVTCESDVLKKECSGGKMENLTQYQHFIMDRHNYYRDLIASGHVAGYESAVRMEAIWRWRDELAKWAELGAKQCDDFTTMRTRSYETNTEERCVNIYRVDNAYAGYTIEEVIRDAIMSWFDESEKCPKSEISYFTGQHTNSCRNFHNMMCDRMNAMGCAMLTKIDGDNRVTIFFCLYTSRTFPMMKPIIPEKPRPIHYVESGFTERVYKVGPMASHCQTRHPQYRGLCMGQNIGHNGRPWSTGLPRKFKSKNESRYNFEEDGAPHCQATFGAMWLILTAFILSRF